MLSIPSPKESCEKPWYIRGWSNPERATMTTEGLSMTCVPKKLGMDSGCGFRAKPFLKFPTESIAFAYEVYFPTTFDFVKGGKLPGVGFGIGDETATGGDWDKDAGSMRIMWREHGQAIGYLYLPLNIAKNKTRDGTITAQNAEFRKAADGALGKHAGIDLFFKQCTGLQFKKGAWNTVRMQVKLNDPKKADGVLDVEVNGIKRRIDGVVFRNDDDIKINEILFHVFFGGSTREWQAKKKETLRFRKCSVEFP